MLRELRVDAFSCSQNPSTLYVIDEEMSVSKDDQSMIYVDGASQFESRLCIMMSSRFQTAGERGTGTYLRMSPLTMHCIVSH